MKKYVVMHWETGQTYEAEAPTAVAACRALGLKPSECLVAPSRDVVAICPYVLDMRPAQGVYDLAYLKALRRHVRSCRTCQRIYGATLVAMRSLEEVGHGD